MIYGLPPNLSPTRSTPYVETAVHLSETNIIVPKDSSIGQFVATYPKRQIALDGGKVLLRLQRDPMLVFDPKSFRWSVEGWGIQVPHEQIHDIDRLMARRFLHLFRQSREDQLNEEDGGAWLEILDLVDYDSFSVERQPAQYMEGTLLRKAPKVRVEWHDGLKEYIPDHAAPSLDYVNENERFSAFVKFGRRGIESIDRVELLPLAAEE